MMVCSPERNYITHNPQAFEVHRRCCDRRVIDSVKTHHNEHIGECNRLLCVEAGRPQSEEGLLCSGSEQGHKTKSEF